MTTIQHAVQPDKTLRDQLARSPHRPIYHFLPGNWMNDPELFYWQGEYHAFFQYYPYGPFWTAMHWGHAVTTDLVHWHILPIALAPTPGGPDSDGVWSGCVLEKDGGFYILYTGISDYHSEGSETFRSAQCLAESEDLIHWQKYAGNPLQVARPDLPGWQLQDPMAWKEGDAWCMMLATEQPRILLYESQDLIHWRYVHLLFEGGPDDCGGFPELFPLCDQHVLLTHDPQARWYVGTYENRRFTTARKGTIDTGPYPNLYLQATRTLLDDRERRIAWGWVRDAGIGFGRRDPKKDEMGFSGVLSLPRLLTLLPDNSLGVSPVPELESLRGRHWHFGNLPLNGKDAILLEGVTGDALELQIHFTAPSAKEVGVVVRCSPDQQERLEIGYNRETKELAGAQLALGKGEDLVLRVFVDRSVVEAFANGRACATRTFYSQRGDCRGIGLFARGGQAMAKSVDIWEMKSIGLWDS